ncbi:hypothetical protein CHH61_26580, partial [Shouchella clausii]
AWEIKVAEKQALFKNGQLINQASQLEVGDQLLWPLMTITLLENDLIQIDSLQDFETILSKTIKPQSEM